MKVVSEDHPARPAAERVAGSLEFRLPLLVATPVLFDGDQHHITRLAVAAEIGEIMLVQHDRAGAYQLFSLEVAVNVRRQVFVTEQRGESLLDGVERFDRAAVVVFPMRFDELFGNAFEFRRVKRHRLYLMLPAKGWRRRRLRR